MKYGIFSDIHGNLSALKIVLSYLNGKGVESFICCGDIVGYGPHPNQCIDMIKGLDNKLVIVGNHDWAAVGMEDLCKFNMLAEMAILWTQKELSNENTEYLKNLEYRYVDNKFMVVHGSPRDPIDEYIFDEEILRENLSFLNKNICFVGHTHIPIYFEISEEERVATLPLNDGAIISFKDNNRYLINIGSVGQPRDGDCRACCGIYDSNSNSLEFTRLEYDIERTQRDMKNFNLPEFLIERLTLGR